MRVPAPSQGGAPCPCRAAAQLSHPADSTGEYFLLRRLPRPDGGMDAIRKTWWAMEPTRGKLLPHRPGANAVARRPLLNGRKECERMISTSPAQSRAAAVLRQ